MASPPTQPTATPSATSNAAKRDTEVPPTPGTPSPSRRENPEAPSPFPGFSEEGNASWYGPPFHGRHSSNGEIYDMNKFTAAHRTLPFNTMVRVTNLTNGKFTVVRITDRGPFVENRIIDLSLAAAQEIEMVGPGVARVRLEILSGIDPTLGFFTVQVGAFRNHLNAENLRDRLSVTYAPIFIQQFDVPDGTYYRVRVGKISGEQAAQQYAAKLRNSEGFHTMVIRLDEQP